jgi:hypothetical protein
VRSRPLTTKYRRQESVDLYVLSPINLFGVQGWSFWRVFVSHWVRILDETHADVIRPLKVIGADVRRTDLDRYLSSSSHFIVHLSRCPAKFITSSRYFFYGETPRRRSKAKPRYGLIPPHPSLWFCRAFCCPDQCIQPLLFPYPQMWFLFNSVPHEVIDV